MPLIESYTGESLLIKRSGVTYVNIDGSKYCADSEPVVNTNYDIAVYVDSLCDREGNLVADEELKNVVFYRIKLLAESEAISLNFFADYGEIYEPRRSDFNDFSANTHSRIVKRKDLGKIIQNDDRAALKVFLKANPDFMTNEQFGFKNESLLHFLASKGKTECCTLLLGMGINPNIEGFDSETPLVRAANYGNKAIVELLVRSGAKIDGLENGIATPLLAAAAAGNKEIVKYLLDHGADVNRKDRELNQTALEIAKNLYHEDIVKILS